MATRIRPRLAHAPGHTCAAYTKNGRKLITVGNDSVIRIFATGSDAEPVNIDVSQETHTALAATDDFFVTGAEDGSVCKYLLSNNALDQILYRSTLPIRSVAISPDDQWVAVASDELSVKLVHVQDMTRVLKLDEQKRSVKHVSFDVSGSNLAASCTDGSVYIYSISHEEPKMTKKLDGLIKMIESDSAASSEVIWHPDGRALAAPTATRAIQVVSNLDWQHHKSFQSEHTADITALAWSPNGALLASAAEDKSLNLWDTRTQQVIFKLPALRDAISSLCWHPTENLITYSTIGGELYIHADILPTQYGMLLQKTLEAAPLRGQPLAEISGNAPRQHTDHSKVNGHGRAETPDSLDEILGPDAQSEAGDDFIVDDDGAGYAEHVNANGKRPGSDLTFHTAKRQAPHRQWHPQFHSAFQPGSTPWRGNRRYLCLNLTGFIWTVDQDSHHTITVEFYDRSAHRDFHFTDPFLYDKACLTEHGAVFSSPSSNRHKGLIYYRPHETWTARTDWRTSLPIGEEVTSLSLSSSFVLVTTNKGYVRVYTLFGIPFRVFRARSGPAITCCSWRDYILTISNGPVMSSGGTSLVYSIENVKRDEIHQADDLLPLPDGAELSTVFWSDKGDPCIFDSTGVLLICLHWRSQGQAKWVPLLDTRAMDRLAGGKKDESYWPVAVAIDRFHCIILKGGDKYPYFPRPLLSEFEFKIPMSTGKAKDVSDDTMQDNDDDAAKSAETDAQRWEEEFVRSSLMCDLHDDLVTNTKATHAQRTELVRKEIEVDKILLRILGMECREGEERGMKALEIVSMFKDRTGKMLEAAGQIASRFGRDLLLDKINALSERRLVGLVDDDDDANEDV